MKKKKLNLKQKSIMQSLAMEQSDKVMDTIKLLKGLDDCMLEHLGILHDTKNLIEQLEYGEKDLMTIYDSF